MGKMMNSIKLGLVASALALGATASQATVVTIGGSALNFTWSFTSGSYTLTGNGSIGLSMNGSDLDALVTLNNTSLAADARLTAFGFGIDPNATGVSLVDSADGGMVDASLDNIPSLKTIEVCAWGGNNCSGGSNGGILGGGAGTDTFHLLMTGSWAGLSTVDIAPIGFKYQTDGGSFEFTSSSSSSSSTSSTSGPTSGDIPEPTSSGLVLVGLGLIGASFMARRRSASR